MGSKTIPSLISSGGGYQIPPPLLAWDRIGPPLAIGLDIKKYKKTNEEFDVPMGAFDGAEVADIVGLFMLSELENLNAKAVWTSYKDDGLAISDAGPQEVEKIKKKVCKTFRENGLEITVDANKKIVQFLDVELNLEDESFKPYIKENDIPLYVNANSNHPKTITKNIPKSVNRRLSALSSSEAIFREVAPLYQAALDKAGYKFKLRYEPRVNNDGGNRSRRARKRHDIIWFNPPFSEEVRTKVGAKYLKLINKHFPKTSPLHKLFNRNTCKISYKTTPNLKRIIAAHNAKLLRESEPNNNQKMCNCRKDRVCPLGGKCLTKNVIYQATVTPTNPPSEPNTYIGLTANTFKQRHANHLKSFKYEKYRKETTLSEHIWGLKDKGVIFELSWTIIDRASPFSPVTGICAICTLEKYYIIFKPELGTINKRDELNTGCRHKTAMLLDKT